MKKRRLQTFLAVSLSTLCMTFEALAVLGDDVSTAARSRRSMPGANAKATSHKTTNNLYSYEELETDGVRVREYASLNGKVFAVTWRGVAEPDLSVLLGKYFSEYKSEDAKIAPSRSRNKNVETGDIKVRRAGHMRDKHGVAFVPTLVPDGVNVGELE